MTLLCSSAGIVPYKALLAEEKGIPNAWAR
jgi:hypothetical protein